MRLLVICAGEAKEFNDSASWTASASTLLAGPSIKVGPSVATVGFVAVAGVVAGVGDVCARLGRYAVPEREGQRKIRNDDGHAGFADVPCGQVKIGLGDGEDAIEEGYYNL